MDLAPARAAAPRTVRFVERFVADAELPAFFDRADLVVLPYREIDQSGVLFTALAFGKPLVLTAVGGFPEVAREGAAELVPPGDPAALAGALSRLLGDPAARGRLAAAARAARDRPLQLGRRRPTPPAPLWHARRVKARTVAFWAPAAALAYAQAGYPLALAALARLRPAGTTGPPPLASHPPAEAPHVALVVAAHAEEDVIAAKVANARALDWPADRLTVVVACDGSPDATPRRAREAGADLVLELPWGGKVRAQDAAVDATDAPLLAFSDANALWEPAALRALVAALEQDGVGYACGSVSFTAHPSGPGPTARTRRACTGATRWRSGPGSRRWPRSPAATARSTPCGGPPTRGSTRSWGTTCRSRSRSCAGGGGPCTPPRPGPPRRWSPRSRGSGGASGG